MPMVTCSETVSWARAACGVPVGRYMTWPGSSSGSSSPSGGCSSHCLVPAVCSTNTSWVSRVHREALRAGRREVGVGLARVAELELELRDQLDQRRERAVQPLEDHRRAVAELLDRLAAVDQPGQLAAGDASRRGSSRSRAAPSRCDQPDLRGPDRGGRQQPVGVLEREVRRELGRVDLVVVDPRRPDLLAEGLGVAGQQVESAQDASPSDASSRRRRSVGVGPVRVATVGPSASPPSVPSASPVRRAGVRAGAGVHAVGGAVAATALVPLVVMSSSSSGGQPSFLRWIESVVRTVKYPAPGAVHPGLSRAERSARR